MNLTVGRVVLAIESSTIRELARSPAGLSSDQLGRCLAELASPPGDEESLALLHPDPHVFAIVRMRSGRADVLSMARELYVLLGDPFAISRRLPPCWDAAGPLSDETWPDELLPPRTVAQLKTIAEREYGSLLYGAAQALVDGAPIRLVRPSPANQLLEDLWQFLPDGARSECTLATWAARIDAPISATVHAELPTELPIGLNENQLLDYPESRYELNLQIAIENEDDEALRRVLRRRSNRAMMRTAVFLLGMMMFLSIGLRMAQAWK